MVQRLASLRPDPRHHAPPEVLQLTAEGKLSSRTTCVGFDDIPDAIATLEHGQTLRRLAVIYSWSPDLTTARRR